MHQSLLIDDLDVAEAFAKHLRGLREAQKWSREALAARSGVPSSTIKKFELSGKIAFRQLLLLWQSLDDLQRLFALAQAQTAHQTLPTSIDEVLRDGF